MMTGILGWLISGEWLSRSLAALLEAGIRGVLLLGAVLLLVGALRTASAATRHAVLGAGIVVVLLMPFAHLSPWRLPILPSLTGGPLGRLSAGSTVAALEANGAVGATETSTKEAVAPALERMEGVGSAAALAENSADDPPPSQGDRLAGTLNAGAAGFAESSKQAVQIGERGGGDGMKAGTPETAGTPATAWALLIAVWLAGMALLTGRTLVGHLRAARLLMSAEPVRDPEWQALLWESADLLDVGKDVRLLWSDSVTMPFATGLLKPTIVLPRDADLWDEDRRRAVLMHELAHVRRGDLLAHYAGRWAACCTGSILWSGSPPGGCGRRVSGRPMTWC